MSCCDSHTFKQKKTFISYLQSPILMKSLIQPLEIIAQSNVHIRLHGCGMDPEHLRVLVLYPPSTDRSALYIVGPHDDKNLHVEIVPRDGHNYVAGNVEVSFTGNKTVKVDMVRRDFWKDSPVGEYTFCFTKDDFGNYADYFRDLTEHIVPVKGYKERFAELNPVQKERTGILGTIMDVLG